MKRFFKTILVLLLVITLTLSATAFTDIVNDDEQTAAETLNSLSIMQGWGGEFHPNDYLTRGQFAKIAVLSINQEKTKTLYENYTIFPDAPYTLWSTGYINACAKLKLIGGYPDGTFKPEGKITDAETIAVCLRMLGYTVSDIGTVWPTSYVNKAAEIGLTNGLTIKANSPITRGRAAIMVRNMLALDNKEGVPMVSLLGKSTKKDVYILATSDTDKTLIGNEVLTNLSETPLSAENKLPIGLVGTKGTLVIGANDTVVGYMPYSYKTVKIIVAKATSTSITDENGTTYNFSSRTPIVIKGKCVEYAQAWQHIVSGMIIKLYKSDADEILYLSYSYSEGDKGPF